MIWPLVAYFAAAEIVLVWLARRVVALGGADGGDPLATRLALPVLVLVLALVWPSTLIAIAIGSMVDRAEPAR